MLGIQNYLFLFWIKEHRQIRSLLGGSIKETYLSELNVILACLEWNFKKRITPTNISTSKELFVYWYYLGNNIRKSKCFVLSSLKMENQTFLLRNFEIFFWLLFPFILNFTSMHFLNIVIKHTCNCKVKLFYWSARCQMTQTNLG